MQGKKVTIEDVAARLGLAKSTVSKALSDATDINQETRERVLHCASAMGYHMKKRRAASGGDVAVFVEGVDYENVDQFGHEILLGFQSEASKARFGVRIVPLGPGEDFRARYEELLTEPRFLGSFFIGFRPHSSFISEFEAAGRPAVLLDNDYDSALTAHVGSDNAAGMEEALAHLASLGHRRVGFLGGEEESCVTAERLAAFEAAARRHGIEAEGRVSFASFYRDYDPSLVLRLVEGGATALVCCSDRIALAALKKLAAAQVDVPGQVSVVGYDGIPLAEYASPALTTISQNSLQLGKSAFRVLQHLTQGVPVSRLALRPSLLVRESTGPAAPQGAPGKS
ncbi:LacI family DNA-binding transcriptional regulator [Anaerofilum sp. BX8]|uniref:LacI family DNA-binding transcriptional regulator n=1 Tax=Anaerofilum hominis TaxID=2763016 RepID=A0A923L0X1_9FIRM|nr:LacI family DNA-binding transcriptional regulator [Anaerofilum hominis]MBC5580253.1 LacI family DNA-binding transcriptional regulator [Anaerofilum hominis]